MSSRLQLAPYLAATIAAVCVGITLSVVSQQAVHPSTAWTQAALIVVCAIIINVSVRSCVLAARGVTGWIHVGSLFLSVGSLAAFLLPGIQFLNGARASRLAQQGLVLTETSVDVARAYLIISGVLIAFFVGEVVASRIRPRRHLSIRIYRSNWNSRATWTALAMLSVLIIVFRYSAGQSLQPTFSARGTAKGEGFVAILGWAPALAVALAVLHRHYRSRLVVAISLLFVGYLVISGNRSPLLLICLALALRTLMTLTTTSRTFKAVVGIPMLAYVAATMLVSISAWRGEIIRGHSTSLVTTSGEALTDPFSKLSGSGLDSLDGLVLATHIDPRTVDASWTDPVKVLTGFIPHQLWPDKPEWLSGTVARTYLHFGASGMFLSGAGYSWLIWGGIGGAILAFFLLGLGSSRALTGAHGSLGVGSLLVIYLLVRFTFAGDAFDGFHVLGLACVVAFAAVIAKVVEALRP